MLINHLQKKHKTAKPAHQNQKLKKALFKNNYTCQSL